MGARLLRRVTTAMLLIGALALASTPSRDAFQRLQHRGNGTHDVRPDPLRLVR